VFGADFESSREGLARRADRRRSARACGFIRSFLLAVSQATPVQTVAVRAAIERQLLHLRCRRWTGGFVRYAPKLSREEPLTARAAIASEDKGGQLPGDEQPALLLTVLHEHDGASPNSRSFFAAAAYTAARRAIADVSVKWTSPAVGGNAKSTRQRPHSRNLKFTTPVCVRSSALSCPTKHVRWYEWPQRRSTSSVEQRPCTRDRLQYGYRYPDDSD
jgi:hypothetical protein